MTPSKNHTISKIVAKAVLRITIILIALPIIVYFTRPEAMATAVSFPNPWSIVAPVLLMLCFVALLIVVLRTKYQSLEYNWLFVLSGIFICLYLVMFYSRVLSIFN
ncbi:hypothetical protein PQ465_03080 [Sphingobacterium oryzagri]|uniref:Uncharacterized protein n=1 Tax=Sphingobacterium oryzagri TaxID=3025669 RepID=A0ABY7WK77_9SPHI|nr:hypothetical protein [Sphingobacterium sp. KACC 22765]WDF69375.1 hypothetical protein PQ465_03080 [Sphingobacterium sp. KACC 22765]